MTTVCDHRADQTKDVKDPFYRYKMESLQSKIEGKGNGIKTVVANLSSVAMSLERPPSCTYSPGSLLRT